MLTGVKKKPRGAVCAEEVAQGWGEVSVPSHRCRRLRPAVPGAGDPVPQGAPRRVVQE